jgi:hypothetical protein
MGQNKKIKNGNAKRKERGGEKKKIFGCYLFEIRRSSNGQQK